MATTTDIQNLRTLASGLGLGWSIGTDHMPAVIQDAGTKDRPVGSVVIRLNAGRTERFVSAGDAERFVRSMGRE